MVLLLQRDRFFTRGCGSAPVFFELFALRSFECVVSLEPRATRHSAPAADAKQRYSTNPERVPVCNRRNSNSCKLSASFLPAPVDAKRHLVARPRCRRSNHVRVPEATGVGYHGGNSRCATLTQSQRLPSSFLRCEKTCLGEFGRSGPKILGFGAHGQSRSAPSDRSTSSSSCQIRGRSWETGETWLEKSWQRKTQQGRPPSLLWRRRPHNDESGSGWCWENPATLTTRLRPPVCLGRRSRARRSLSEREPVSPTMWSVLVPLRGALVKMVSCGK